MAEHFEVLTMGRVGVDLYPLQDNVGLEDVDTFSKSVGGSAGNVAIAAAKHGRRAALISRTGPDAFGKFVHKALREMNVDDRFITEVPDLLTPVTFCEMYPPDHFPLLFYRLPIAPDLVIQPGGTRSGGDRRCGHLLDHGDRAVRRTEPVGAPRRLGGAGQAPADHSRPGLPAGVLDRPGRGLARRCGRRCRMSPSRSATRKSARSRSARPSRCAPAKALLDAGVELAIVKQGPKGVLGMTKDTVSRCRRRRSR